MSSTSAELSRLIHTLQQERQQHADAVAQIDAAFISLGITAQPSVRRGRKPGVAQAPAVAPLAASVKPAGNRRRRRKAKDGMTGDQFLLGLLGRAKLATADVNKQWATSGRKGSANNLLGKLVKEGKVSRKQGKGQRGSVYSVV